MKRLILAGAILLVSLPVAAGTTIYVLRQTCVDRLTLACFNEDLSTDGLLSGPHGNLKYLAGCTAAEELNMNVRRATYSCSAEARAVLLDLCRVSVDKTGCETAVDVSNQDDLRQLLDHLQDRQDDRFEKMLKALDVAGTAPDGQPGP